MDKFSSFEKYRSESFYHSDKSVDHQEINQTNNWDKHYVSDGSNMSSAEMAKTIEMMNVLRDEVAGLAEQESFVKFEGSSFKREVGSQIEGTEVITIRDLNNPGFLIQIFKGGREDGKVKTLLKTNRSEIDIILQNDGNFQFTRESNTKRGFITEAFSTRPRDKAIGFKRMTSGVTKQAVEIINGFLKNTPPYHRPNRPSVN